jgi:hypothetical protein
MRLFWIRLVLASCCVLGSRAAACQGTESLAVGNAGLRLRLDAGGRGASWSVSVNKGPPDIRVSKVEGIEVLEMRSSRTSFGLQRLVRVDLARYPILAWSWRADALPRGGDFRAARTDDQAASIYIAFSPARAIGYIWDSSAPAGSIGDCVLPPPIMKIRIFVLRSGSGDAGRWLPERRDLRRDYEAAFGERMPDAEEVGLRIWINSQHTGTEAASAFADLRFEG